MKKHLFLLLFAIVISVGTIYAWDYEQVQIGDLYYNLDATEKIAEVTKNDSYSALITVNIPASVTYESITYGVTSVGDGAFFLCQSLTSITIPNSVTSIGNSAFSDCSSLTSVTIPNSVTSIGVAAFYYCSGLTSVTIPNSVTSIENSAFSGCSSLISVTIPNSVTSIENGTFSGCSSLTSVTIPNSVTNIGSYVFSGCSSLTSVTIPNSVTSIGESAFRYCSSLTSPVYNAHVFAYMPESYSGAYTIPDGIESIAGGAFNNCSGLISVRIPNSITSIGDVAFFGCSGLTSVTIPTSVTSIGHYAFYGCSGLISVTIPNSVTSIGYDAFGGVLNVIYSGSATGGSPWGARCYNGYVDGWLCYSDNTKTELLGCARYATGNIDIPNSVTSIASHTFDGCSRLTTVTIPNSVTSIGSSAFSGCSSLTSVTIPNSVTSIGNWAFSGCSGLTSVTIPNSVTSIGMLAFAGCSSLTSVTIPNSVTSIGGRAFADCSSLTSVTIPNSVTSIGDGAFQNCSGLASVTIGNNATSIGERAFYLCNNITSVVWNVIDSPDFQKNVTPFYHPYDHIEDYDLRSQIASFSFGDEVKHVPAYLCNGMEKLTSVTIPNSVTSIGNNAFSDCSGLTSISVGTGNIKYDSRDNCNAIIETASNTLIAGCKNTIIPNSVTSIGNQAFSNCSSLTSVIIPNSVTNIGNSAFIYCDNLRDIVFGTGLEKIEVCAFFNCNSIETITFYGMSPPTVEEGAFNGLTDKTIIYVPADYLHTYRMSIWGLCDLRPIGAASTQTDEVKIEPTTTTANVVWPAVDGAATYELVIKDKQGNVICTLIFNSNGQLTEIAFNAPSRYGEVEQTQASGFSFTVTGLEEGTAYELTITSKDSNGATLDEKTIAFSTAGSTGVENTQSDGLRSTKVLRDGQILILRGEKTYTAQGQEVR